MVEAGEQAADKAMMLMRAQPTNTLMNALHVIQARRLSTVKICRMRTTTDILAKARVGMSSIRPANKAWESKRVSSVRGCLNAKGGWCIYLGSI